MSLFGFIGSALGGLFGGNSQAKAADKAAQLQNQAAMAGIAETQRQFDITRADFAPYQALGTKGAASLGNLTGINGDAALNAEIARIMAGPRYQSLLQNGRDEMLATAAATGGLRGGNFQDASQRFGADTLSSEIGRQLSEYAGLVGIGQGASGAVGNFGANSVAQQAALRGQGADAASQAALIRGGIAGRNWQNLGTGLDGLIWDALGGGGKTSSAASDWASGMMGRMF